MEIDHSSPCEIPPVQSSSKPSVSFDSDGKLISSIGSLASSVEICPVTTSVNTPPAKPRSQKPPLDSPCRVCGGRAAGMYFGALVCVPCKTFFLRYGVDYLNFVCKNNKSCSITYESRTVCKFCRYQKCLMAGMQRKVRPTTVELSEGQQVCVVCDDVANGIHFGVITCEGCKKFFRRGLKEHTSYVCKNNGLCVINPQTRNSCRRCRYVKCIRSGMSREAIQMGRPSKVRVGIDDPRFVTYTESVSSVHDGETGGIESNPYVHQRTETELQVLKLASDVKDPILATATYGPVPSLPVSCNTQPNTVNVLMSEEPTSGCPAYSLGSADVDGGLGGCDPLDWFDISGYRGGTHESAQTVDLDLLSQLEDSLGQNCNFMNTDDTRSFFPVARNGVGEGSQDLAVHTTQSDLQLSNEPLHTDTHTASPSGSSSYSASVALIDSVFKSPSALSQSPGKNPKKSLNRRAKRVIINCIAAKETATAQIGNLVHDVTAVSPVSSIQSFNVRNAYGGQPGMSAKGFPAMSPDSSTGTSSLNVLSGSANVASSGMLKEMFANHPTTASRSVSFSTATVLCKNTIGTSVCNFVGTYANVDARSAEHRGSDMRVSNVSSQSSQVLQAGTSLDRNFVYILPGSGLLHSQPSILSDKIVKEKQHWVGKCLPVTSVHKLPVLSDVWQILCTINNQIVTKNANKSVQQGHVALQGVDFIRLYATSSQYWLSQIHEVVTDDSLLLCASKLTFIKEILKSYDRFVATSAEINITLERELKVHIDSSNGGQSMLSTPCFVQSRVVPLFTTTSVTYCMNLPGFKSLHPEDRQTLIRLGQSPSRILVAACSWYDVSKKDFVHFMPWRNDAFRQKLIAFAEKINGVCLDKVEAALLNLLVIIATDYPGLSHPESIERIHNCALNALRAYLVAMYGNPNNRLEMVLCHLTELRGLGYLHHCMTQTKNLTVEEVMKNK